MLLPLYSEVRMMKQEWISFLMFIPLDWFLGGNNPSMRFLSLRNLQRSFYNALRANMHYDI